MNSHGGNIEAAARQYGRPAADFIDFSASINPLGFPAGLKKIISDNLGRVAYYPDPDCQTVRARIARYLNIAGRNLLAGNGSIELIFLLASVLRPKKALIILPTFSEYERAVVLSGGRCVFLKARERDNFEVKIELVLRKLASVELVFLCNPNNPTGSLCPKEPLKRLADECEKRGIFLVLDEVFMDFVENGPGLSMLRQVCKRKYLLVLQSLTKFFGLAGLRLGYLAAAEGLIRKLSSAQVPWSVNALVQAAGAKILNDVSFIKESRNYLFSERVRLVEALGKIKYLKVYPPGANFVFCKVLSGAPGAAGLCGYCGRQGMLIRDCSNFRGLDGRFIRIAVRKEKENKKLLKVLRNFAID